MNKNIYYNNFKAKKSRAKVLVLVGDKNLVSFLVLLNLIKLCKMIF